MADIMLHTSSASQVTCVSNTFIDNFMKDANGEYVKIYLFLLRCLGREGFEFSLSEVADHLDHTEKDVMRALTYWEKVGLLRLEYSADNELSGICLNDVSGYVSSMAPVTANAPALQAEPVGALQADAVPENTVPEKRSYSPEELDSFTSDDEVQDLLFVSSTYIGRPLSVSESQSILYWHDSLKMSIDLIEYLIETCVGSGHTSFHYMETVAVNWAKDGITSVDEAKNNAKIRSAATYSIMKYLGISNRNLIPDEQEFVDKWTNVYRFDLAIIEEACKRTIQQTNKPSFKYADSILSSWSEQNVRTLEDINLLDSKRVSERVSKIASAPASSPRAPKKKNEWERPVDAGKMAAIEKMMMNK